MEKFNFPNILILLTLITLVQGWTEEFSRKHGVKTFKANCTTIKHENRYFFNLGDPLFKGPHPQEENALDCAKRCERTVGCSGSTYWSHKNKCVLYGANLKIGVVYRKEATSYECIRHKKRVAWSIGWCRHNVRLIDVPKVTKGNEEICMNAVLTHPDCSNHFFNIYYPSGTCDCIYEHYDWSCKHPSRDESTYNNANMHDWHIWRIMHVDECGRGPNPCENGGTCRNLYNRPDIVDGFKCDCAKGFKGQLCTENINDCKDVTCQNNGVCVDKNNDFECKCPPGFSGKHCEIDDNECSEVNCKNGGECVDKVNGYECKCLPGFTGDHCEIDTDDCQNAVCLNGGTCVDEVNGYRCTCAKGFLGKHCEKDEFELIDGKFLCEGEKAQFNNGENLPAGVKFDNDVPGYRKCGLTSLKDCQQLCADISECGHLSYNANSYFPCCFIYESNKCKTSTHAMANQYLSYTKTLRMVPPPPRASKGSVKGIESETEIEVGDAFSAQSLSTGYNMVSALFVVGGIIAGAGVSHVYRTMKEDKSTHMLLGSDEL